MLRSCSRFSVQDTRAEVIGDNQICDGDMKLLKRGGCMSMKECTHYCKTYPYFWRFERQAVGKDDDCVKCVCFAGKTCEPIHYHGHTLYRIRGACFQVCKIEYFWLLFEIDKKQIFPLPHSKIFYTKTGRQRQKVTKLAV